MNLPNIYKQILKLWYDIRYNTNSANQNYIQQNIHHILDKEGQFLSHTHISAKYNVTCHFLELLQIRMAIPIEWRVKLRSHPVMANNYPTEPKLFLALQNELELETVFGLHSHDTCTSIVAISG